MTGIAFYEAAAQIIPIMLLVLVVETRFLQRTNVRKDVEPWRLGSSRP